MNFFYAHYDDLATFYSNFDLKLTCQFNSIFNHRFLVITGVADNDEIRLFMIEPVSLRRSKSKCI